MVPGRTTRRSHSRKDGHALRPLRRIPKPPGSVVLSAAGVHRRAPTTTGPSPLPAYRNSPQSDGLKLVPKEIQSSPAVEGELPEDGLAAYGDDLMLAPARKIMSGAEEDDAKTQQSQFARAGFPTEEPAAEPEAA